MTSRYVVGIDLGTTNCALALVDTGGARPSPSRPVGVPQVVAAGQVESRPLLPSYLYLPGPGEQPVGALRLPWDTSRDYAVGEFARAFGAKVPTRLVSSAKSWLAHPEADPRAEVLPFRAGAKDRKISAVDACTRYLRHLAEAWNHEFAADVAEYQLATQEVVLTVPASFDAAARELTVEAAAAAGLEQVTILEEPQAAFYAWLDRLGDRWREAVTVGDLVLVADVGGGTSDFTLIEVLDAAGTLELTRVAVGEHLLLGGDNMDLALAHSVAYSLSQSGTKVDASQMPQLAHAVRQAKELLLADTDLTSAPVTLMGKGRSVLSGTVRFDLSRAEVERVLVEGFFPECEPTAVPKRSSAGGLQELGLPYVADPAMTKHLAQFLARHGEAARERGRANALPTRVLFNGGVFKAQALRERLLSVLNRWSEAAGGPEVTALDGADLDQAVGRGAAYYGLVRRGDGIRIRGGTGRAYYIGIETAAPAVPGMAPPLKALCVAPLGMEEGTEVAVTSQPFGLVIGQEVEFRFLGSTVRHQDQPGDLIDDWEGEIEELLPLRVTLEGGGDQVGRRVPVQMHARVTETGQLELSCEDRTTGKRWKLGFNAREHG